MGLLSEGSPLSWAETQKHAEHVRRHGIKQFIHLYHQLKDRTNDDLKWGDEVEYMLVRLNDKAKEGRLLLEAGPILHDLQVSCYPSTSPYPQLWVGLSLQIQIIMDTLCTLTASKLFTTSYG